MTRSAPPALLGSQRPRLSSFPPSAGSSSGPETVELAASAGLILDPWQRYSLDVALAEKPDARWASFEVALIVARQNGKGGVLEARELAGLFLFAEELILHSAHQFDTALEAFRRILFLIENTPDLDSRVKRVSRAHGEEGVELKPTPTLITSAGVTRGRSSRLRFKARTAAGGRGFSGDCVILDEGMILPEAAIAALMPTMSARPNPQLWYVGSAVDRNVHEHGKVLSRIRARGVAGGDASLCYLEWSAEDEDDRAAADTAAKANPGMGIRIPVEHIELERRSMAPETYDVERLGIGNWWPPDEDAGDPVFDVGAWDALTDEQSRRVGPVAFGVEVSWDRSEAVIAAAGRRRDGLRHVEAVDLRAGSAWLLERIVKLAARPDTCAVVIDAGGPAASLLPALAERDVDVMVTTTAQVKQACGAIYDDVTQRGLRHIGQPQLAASVEKARKRPLGDGFAWDRRAPGKPMIVMSVTLALYGLLTGSVPPAPVAPVVSRNERASETYDLASAGF